MAVIIEEFEVLPERTPPAEKTTAEPQKSSQPSRPPSPADVSPVLGHLARRQQRLQAH